MVKRFETPVLIVGAGPIGLTLALDLAWRGQECMIIDQGDGTVELPRGAMVAARTMEFCRRWGIAERVRTSGFPDDYKLDVVFCTSLAGHLLARDEYPAQRDTKPPPFSPEKRTWCPQPLFDPVIAKAVSEYSNATMRYGCLFKSFEDRGDHVLAHAEDMATKEHVEIRAQYLVACDGSASVVRKALNIESDGTPVLSYSINIFFKAPTLLDSTRMGEAERYLFVGDKGGWGNITVVDGRERWRLTVFGSIEKADMEKFDARAQVRRAIGRDDMPFELIAVRPWRRTQQIAREWRVGRVILAGDSAHTMSPTGGFGMNTGVIDSANLGWKLKAVLDGWAGPALLDSYMPEQRPVSLRNSVISSEYFTLWVKAQKGCDLVLNESPEGEQARREVGQRMKETLESEWQSYGVQLGYRYEGSPICIPDGTPPTPDDEKDYVQTSRPGARAPHGWLGDGRSTIDLFGKNFVLLRFDAQDLSPLVSAAKAQNLPLEIVDIAEPSIAKLYERKLVLVRPDGHTAWRGDTLPGNPANIIATVRGAAKAPVHQS